MSDWKNDRAEAEMREAGEKIMKAAALKAEKEKLEEENKAWEAIYEDLSLGNSEDDKDVIFVLKELRKKYDLPKKKTND